MIFLGGGDNLKMSGEKQKILDNTSIRDFDQSKQRMNMILTIFRGRMGINPIPAALRIIFIRVKVVALKPAMFFYKAIICRSDGRSMLALISLNWDLAPG